MLPFLPFSLLSGCRGVYLVGRRKEDDRFPPVKKEEGGGRKKNGIRLIEGRMARSFSPFFVGGM